jgi:phosphoadenosine phosphosulfate reductase
LKPIFKEEKLFLENKLGLSLPDDCWRDGKSIYLNSDKKLCLIKFKIENKQFIVTKNNLDDARNYTNLSLNDEIKLNKDRLIALEQNSINKAIEYINKYKGYELRISHSGGKDSDVLYYIMLKVFDILKVQDWKIDFFNTSNDTAQTYLHVKNDLNKEKLEIHNPKKGWKQWLKEDKNYFIPSVTVRNCCSTYKEGQVHKVLDKQRNYIMFLGLRKYESTKRASYDYDLNEVMGKKSNMPSNWRRILPIVEWTDVDVWLYMLMNDIKFNEMYRLGFNRVGCLLCPYMNDYIDVLIEEYYPVQLKSWNKILEKNYENTHVKDRLKWTLDEWKDGKWKQGKSKVYEIIQLKATEENVKQVADILGISINMARKYFNKSCSCGKILNPSEIGMFYKLYGRYEDVQDDNRVMLCKDCVCKEMNISGKEYNQMMIKFRDKEKCNLF